MMNELDTYRCSSVAIFGPAYMIVGALLPNYLFIIDSFEYNPLFPNWIKSLIKGAYLGTSQTKLKILHPILM